MATQQPPTDDPPVAASAHNILTIPLELFERIAQVAEPEDLLNLRLVSREARDNVKRTFIERHFTRRMFLLCCEESLKTLLAIAEHPEFGRTMRTVMLCNEEVPGPEHVMIREGDYPRVEIEAKHPMDARILACLQDREWHRLREEQEEFFARDGDIEVLTSIFSAFRLNGNTPAVDLIGLISSDMSARGARTLELLSGRELFWGEDKTRPLYGPLCAVSKAAFPLTELSIGYGNFHWSFYQLVRDSKTKAAADSIFPSLRKLRIRSDHADHVTGVKIAEVVALLGGCTQLEELCFRFFQQSSDEAEYAGHDEFVTAFLDRIALPDLKRLVLQRWALPFHGLVAFLNRHDKLASVILRLCNLHGIEHHEKGVNTNHGSQDGSVACLLQDATGLRDVVATRCTVQGWQHKEQVAGEDASAEDNSDEGSEYDD